MDFLKYFSYHSQKMMISPYYFGPPVLIDPVCNSLVKLENIQMSRKWRTYYLLPDRGCLNVRSVDK
jgi:hypothetical protein